MIFSSSLFSLTVILYSICLINRFRLITDKHLAVDVASDGMEETRKSHVRVSGKERVRARCGDLRTDLCDRTSHHSAALEYQPTAQTRTQHRQTTDLTLRRAVA